MIELAILGILEGREAHGYELNKRMADLAVGSGGVSYGSLYPALNRLERAGSVRAVDPSKPRLGTALSGPMTGAITGELAALRQRKAAEKSERAESGHPTRRTDKRNRKVYGITEKGRERLRELLMDVDPSDERTFDLQVAFCRQLSPIDRLTVFERRRSHLSSVLAGRSDVPIDSDPYLRSLREHDTQTLDNDLRWLDELIALARADLAEPTREPVAAPSTGG